MRLLLIEDEEDLASSLLRGLRAEGFAVDHAADGEVGLGLVEVEQYDVILLDLSLPKIDGLEVLRRVREQDLDLMILLLTARAQPGERTLGLDAGADDYLTKPFYFEELCARVRALLRRKNGKKAAMLCCGDLRIDPARRVAFQGDRALSISRKALAVLEYLMHHASEVVSQEELLDHVWDAEVNPFTNVVAVHINALRQALDDDARHPRYIRTVVGEGYMLLPGRSGT